MDTLEFSCARGDLLRALRTIAGAVERKSGKDEAVLSNVLIDIQEHKILLTTTDNEIELQSSISEFKTETHGTVMVPFRKLYDICRVLPDDAVINLAVLAVKVTVKSGRSRFTLASLAAESFPIVSENLTALDLEIDTQQFKHILDTTCFAMAEIDVRHFLNGTLLDFSKKQLTMVAADGHRLAVQTMDFAKPQELQQQILVPRKCILELGRLLGEEAGTLNISLGNNHIRFGIGNTVITSKLLGGRFPDYDMVIPKKCDKIIVADRLELKAALQCAAALFTEKQQGVRLTLQPNNLQINAIHDQDKAEEEIVVDYSGEELSLGLNVRYLLEVLNALTSERVQLECLRSDSSVLITAVGDETGQYVVMPMRL